MGFQQKGTIKLVGKTKQVSDTFKVRELILGFMDGEYPQLANFQFMQTNCSKLDDVSTGEEVIVHFDLRGRKNKAGTGVFNTLSGWKIEKVGGSGRTPTTEDYGNSDGDPLPF